MPARYPQQLGANPTPSATDKELSRLNSMMPERRKILVVSFAGEDETTDGVIIKIEPEDRMDDVKRECGLRMNIPNFDDIEFRDEAENTISSLRDLVARDVAYLVMNGCSCREILTLPTVPLLGSIPYLVPDIIGSIARYFKEYNTPLLQLYSFQQKSLTTNHPAIAEIFAKESEYFTKKIALPFAEVKAIGGDGLFTTDSDEQIWKLGHKLLVPAFSAPAMKSYATEMGLLAKKLVHVFDQVSLEPEPVLITPWMTKITFETIGRVGFGFDFGLLDSKDAPIHPFIDAMKFCLQEVRTRAFRSQYWKKLPIWSNYQFDRMMKLMKDTVDDVIIQRKNSADEKDSAKDLLGFMLNARDKVTGEKLPDAIIRDQVVTFLIAGHETTSNTLSWCLYCLSRHPAVLKNVLQEIANAGITSDEVPTISQISHLKYLTQVLKETLRMYPPLASLQKSCIKDCRLPFGYFVEEGTVVQINIFALHRNPRIWKDPEVFNPNRFTSSEESQRSRYSWLPFSTGPRACIGMQFALQEAKIILAMLLRKFEFQLPDEKPVYYDIASGIILKPKDLFFKISRRVSFPVATQKPPSEVSTPFTNLTNALTLSSPPANVKLPKFTVLFGSNMGLSEEYATKIAIHATSFGFKNVDVSPLDDWEVLLNRRYDASENSDDIAKPIVVIVTSTYNGLPPDNAVKFDQFISTKRDISQVPLKGLRYAVFGCGNKQWRTYQMFPRKVNDRLEYLGAEQLFPPGVGNADADSDVDFTEWLVRFYASLLSEFGLKGNRLSSINNTTVPITSQGVLLNYLPADSLKTQISDQKQDMAQAIVRKNSELQNVSISGRSTRHVEIELSVGQSYETGDHLEIFPENDPSLVEEVADLLGYSLDSIIEVKIESISNLTLSSRSLASNLKGPITIRNVLTHYADIKAAPSRQFLTLCISSLSETCHESTKQYLQSLCQLGDQANQGYSEFIEKNRCLIDLLQNFPMLKIELLDFLCAMQVMKKRRYSIASCPQVYKNVAHVCLGVVEDLGYQSKIYRGLCSGFLYDCLPGRVIRAEVRKAKAVFHLPDDPTIPVVMVCTGTGIAPFRGFLQERRSKGYKSKTMGGQSNTYLFFGCRSPEHDFLYRKELEEFLAEGTLDDIKVAYSRIGSTQKYVQHNLLASASLLWDLINTKSGSFYVCGSSRMATDVYTAMVSIFEQVGGMSNRDANTYVLSLRQEGKYNEDVWG